MLRLAALIIALATLPLRACETALLLAVDISGSIDAGEYAIQMQGLEIALNDPDVTAALVQGQVALAVVHWSGVGRQALVMPWQRMLTTSQVAAFARRAGSVPRAFNASDTAVGEAIGFSAAQFAAVRDCRRHVIDISGDGPENAGFTVIRERATALAQGIEINAIAIEEFGSASSVTNFYRRWVIGPTGFVVTARSVADYPATLRIKLLRELTRPVS